MNPEKVTDGKSARDVFEFACHETDGLTKEISDHFWKRLGQMINEKLPKATTAPPQDVEWEDIGFGYEYETAVFPAGEPCMEIGCCCGLPDNGGVEIERIGYNNAKSAKEGHMQLCKKYSELKASQAAEVE